MIPTDDQLKEWRALADKAMPGPWMEMERCDNAPPGESCGVVSGLVAAHGGAVDVFASDAYDECSHPVTTADAAFIAAARTAVPALIAEVERLRADVAAADERMAGVLDGTFSVGDGTAQREIARLRADESEIMRVVAAENHRCDSLASVPRLVEELAVIAATAAEEHADNERLRAELARLRPIVTTAIAEERATSAYVVTSGGCDGCRSTFSACSLHAPLYDAMATACIDRETALQDAIETAEAKEKP